VTRRLFASVVALAAALATGGCQLVLGIDPNVQVLEGGLVDSANEGGARDATGPADAGDARADPVFWVYRDGNLSWSDGPSFGISANTKDETGAPPSGQYDIKVTLTSGYGAWAAAPLSPPFNTSAYEYLIFSLKPTKATQQWSCYTTNAKGLNTTVHLSDYLDGGSYPPEGEWTSYKIPLSAIGADTSITKFVIQDQTQLTTNDWFIDDVGLTR
jgi:hypothetical protein